MSKTYSFNDYFSTPDSKSIEIQVSGLTFRIKKTLTLGEKQKAQDASIKLSISAEGIPSIDSLNQGAYTTEIVLAALREWPFTYPDDYEVEALRGQPVPITRETVSALDEYLSEEIAARALRVGEVQRQGLVPFGKK